MLRFYVDFNLNDDNDLPDTIAVRLDVVNTQVRADQMKAGDHVLLFDVDCEYEAVLGRGKRFDWVAKIIPETMRKLSQSRA